MAALTTAELTDCRNLMEEQDRSCPYTKAQLNAALQACATLLDQASTKTAINNAIESAASGVFTAAQKVRIFKAAVLRYGLN